MDSHKFHAIMNGTLVNLNGEVVLAQTEENLHNTQKLARLIPAQPLKSNEIKTPRIKLPSSQIISVF